MAEPENKDLDKTPDDPEGGEKLTKEPDAMDPVKEKAAAAPPADSPETKVSAEEANGGEKKVASPGAAPNKPATKKKKGTKKSREKNPKFKDVEETGSWGTMSSAEMYGAIAFFVVVVIGVIVAVVVVVSGREDPEPSVVPTPPRATSPPTSAPTDISPEKLLNNVLDDIYDNDQTFAITDVLPLKSSDYEGFFDDPNATPQERAISWVLFEDEWNQSADATTRWALASIYFHLGGAGWPKQENWLSSESMCDWEGLECEPITGNLREMDLQRNGLSGTIPSELSLLSDLQSILWRENELTGRIPGEVFGSLPKLTILYLDNNNLTGQVPGSMNGGALNSLFLQFNDLTGEVPSAYCPAGPLQPRPIERMGIDCEEVLCSSICCDAYTCYYGDPIAP